MRFVQLTVAKKHSFKIESFYKLLNNLSKVIVKQLHLEIYFLFPSGPELSIHKVTGEGLLSAFGWEKSKESGKVKKCTTNFRTIARG